MFTEALEDYFTFAEFRLYPKQRTLLHGEEVVTLGARAFDVLHLLVSRAGSVVSLHELMSFVWPNITVEEANLRVQMGILRKALGRCSEGQRAIETVPLRGYCFIIPVRNQSRHNVEQSACPTRSPTITPPLINSVIGRDDAIETIGNALTERRLVTVTGPGGIGKTTVAVAVANRLAPRLEGPTAFADLSNCMCSDSAVATIGNAIGLPVEERSISAICGELRQRDTLLILDTCEHIVDSISMITELLLSNCTRLRILVTSREALRATGEWSHRLPSLTFPDQRCVVTNKNIKEFTAISLFIDRVRSSTRFELKQSDLPIIAEICRRLDGIPLALEFAAARVADLGLREIYANLDDRFSILTRGRRTALPRHQTMSAAIQWSYSLLSVTEQNMLKHLATIDGSFTADSLHLAVIDPKGLRSVDALSGLYEKSLITVDHRNDAPIYRLFDTTKAYVRGLDHTD